MHLYSLHYRVRNRNQNLSILMTPNDLCLISFFLIAASFFPVINDFFLPGLDLSFMSPCGVFTQKIIQSIVAQQLMRLVVKWMTQRLQKKKNLSVSGEYHSVPAYTHTHTPSKHTQHRDSGLPCTPHRYPSAPSPPRRHYEMQNKG